VKKILITLFAIVPIGLILIILHIASFKKLKPDESYPYDTYLDNEKNKVALIIVAHDDDATLFAGTTSRLAEEGWDVNFLCFYAKHWRPEDNPVRKIEMEKVSRIQGLKTISLIDMEIRKRLDTVTKPWMPISYEDFAINFKLDSLNMYIKDAINRSSPSVIFMLDNKIGLYGHPEHVAVGKVIEDLCRLYQDSMGFSVKKIYQGVLPSSQAQNMMGLTDIYNEAINIYHCNGMPLPDVQINIYPYAKKKKSVLLAHASQHRNIKKLFIFYKFYPAKIYFKLFDKEYFNIIDI
jgi:LmbE family N-acetylglucosaminyl deacetylase